jgi:Putative peptidoglycan binding domain
MAPLCCGFRPKDSRFLKFEASGAMTGERRRGTGSEQDKSPLRRPPPFGSERPIRRPTPEEVDRHGDEIFKQSIADLSRRLAEQAAKQAAADPRAEAEKRRAALLAYNLARKRRLKMAASGAGLALAAACVAWFVVSISAPPSSETTASASPPPATKVETANITPPSTPAPAPATAPTPAPTVSPTAPATSTAASEPPPSAPPPPSPAPVPSPTSTAQATAPSTTASVPPPPAAKPAPRAAVAPAPPPPAPWPPPPRPSVAAARAELPPAELPQMSRATGNDSAPGVPQASAMTPAPDPTPLQRAEIREVQTKLYTFGFNPGPIDGTAGPMTQKAVTQYQADRGLAQTGTVDRALLEELRDDPAPQVAQAPPPAPAPRPARTYARRSSDPFGPLRQAGDRLSQWFQSLGR